MVRRGRRAGRPRLVVHALMTPPAMPAPRGAGSVTGVAVAQPTRAERSARVGFVVSKAVGNSVVRHRVTRRLRHLMADRIGTLPAGSTLVIRALPAAAGATSSALGADLDGALRRLNPYLCGDVV